MTSPDLREADLAWLRAVLDSYRRPTWADGHPIAINDRIDRLLSLVTSTKVGGDQGSVASGLTPLVASRVPEPGTATPSERLEARFVICSSCGGEGIWDVNTGDWDSTRGEPVTETERCSTCGGSGQVEEEPEARTLADMDDDPDPYSAFGYRGGNP
jgi:hypothetical protein